MGFKEFMIHSRLLKMEVGQILTHMEQLGAESHYAGQKKRLFIINGCKTRQKTNYVINNIFLSV